MSSHRLKIRLINNKQKQHKCEFCNRKKWNNKPIPIELHHINGNHKDNRIENLLIVCPNCHAQTDNYKSKNRISSKHGKDLSENDIIQKINSCYSITEVLRNLIPDTRGRSQYLRDLCKKIIQDKKANLLVKQTKAQTSKVKKIRIKKTYLCQDCHCEISKYSNRCKNCHAIFTESLVKPPKEVLINDIENMGYLSTGKKYNVCDNTVRKWIKVYNLDPKKIRYKNYKLSKF